MKFQDRRQFFRDIKRKIPSVVLMVAPEEEQKGCVEELQLLLKTKKIPILFLHPSFFSLEKFSQEVETIPFLSKKRALVLLHVDRFLKKDLENIILYLEKPNSWTHLILIGAKITQTTKLFKICDKQGVIFHLKEKKSWEKEKELIEYLVHKAASVGVALLAGAAKALVENLGSDRLLLVCELDKLICYVGQRSEITIEDVSCICSKIHKQSLWQLTDAILAKNLRHSLLVGRALLEDGLPIYSLIPSIRTQIVQALQILGLHKQGGEPRVTSSFPYLRGKFLEKKIQIAQRFGSPSLKKGLVHLAAFDLKSKNTQISPQLLLEQLLTQLCL